MESKSWLKQVRADLKEILGIVAECDEPYKQKCFEILFSRAVNAVKVVPAASSEAGKGGTEKHDKPKLGRFQSFLSQYGITVEDLSRLVDLDTGDVLVTGLGDEKADVQRKLAMLVSIYHFAKEGELLVPKVELQKKCVEFGVYVPKHFVDHMKEAKWNKTVLFVKVDAGWKVTSPASGYVAEFVKSLLK